MIFSSNNSTYIDGMMFVPVTFPYNVPDALLIEDLKIQHLIEYCNKKQIKKVFIQGIKDFEFIKTCKSIQHIAIELQIPFKTYSELKSSKIVYDLNCLQDLPHLKEVLLQAEQLPIKGIFYYDISVVEYKRELSLTKDLVWNQEHLATNYST